MPQKMYKVADGKHQMPDGSFVRASDPAFPMDDEEVAKFPGKFVLQVQPQEAKPEKAPEKDPAKTADPAKAAAPAAPAK